MKKILWIFCFSLIFMQAYSQCNTIVTYSHTINGNLVSFIGTGTPDDTGQYIWYFGDGDTAIGKNVQHNYSESGIYSVCIKYEPLNSIQPWPNSPCYAIFCDSITIEGCNFQASFTNHTSGKNVAFSGNTFPNEPGIYTWNFGDGNTGYGQNIQHHYSDPGTYPVCMTYKSFNNSTNGDTCSAFTCDTIIIEECNVQASFTKNIAGNMVSFSGFNTPGSPGQYSWYFGDGHTAYGKNTQHHYSAPGIYVVCMSFEAYELLSNGDSCYSYACDTITIEGCNLQASFNKLISGNMVSFSGSASPNEAGSYNWNFGDGSTGYGQNTQHHYTAPGNYIVCMTYQTFNPLSNGDTCFATFCDTITIAGCNSQVSIKDSLVGKTIYLTGNTNPLKSGSYEWTLGDGKKRTGKKITYQYAKPGTYTICVKFKSQDGLCNIQTCKTIVIRKCYVDVRFTKTVSKDTVRFTAVSLPDLPGTYYWNFGDGVIGSGKTAMHIYATSGNYPVTLSFYSEDSKCICEAIFTDTVRVKVCPKINFTQFSNAKTVTFSAYSDSFGSGTYYWNFGDGTYETGQTVSHTYSNVSNYTATVEFYSHNGFCQCLCKSSFSNPVIFESCDTVSFISQTSGNYAYFNAYPAATGIFQWNFGDGNTEFTYTSNAGHFYTNTGSYPVELTAILTSDDHMDTCITTSSSFVYIYGDSSWAKETSVTLYPMPVADKLNYKIENNNSETIRSVEIIDPMGVVVKKTESISPDINSIDVNNLASGLYILKIISGGKVYSKSFLKN